MIFNFETRSSDAPLAERVWSNRCEPGGPFLSVATHHWQLVVSRLKSGLSLTVRGPETVPSMAECPPDAEHFGVYFKLGSFLPEFPVSMLTDRAITLPSDGRYFWMKGHRFEFPSFENMDTFVMRLSKSGLLAAEPAVEQALLGGRIDLSLRSVERKFLAATGLRRGIIQQINRARDATMLLKSGLSIADAALEAGYADQPHLTRSLKRFIGRTPAQISRRESSEQLSFLFKTGLSF